MSRTEEASHDEHKDLIEYVMNNDLNNHALIVSNGKVRATELPSHGQVSIVTEDSKVTKVQAKTSELF